MPLEASEPAPVARPKVARDASAAAWALTLVTCLVLAVGVLVIKSTQKSGATSTVRSGEPAIESFTPVERPRQVPIYALPDPVGAPTPLPPVEQASAPNRRDAEPGGLNRR